MARVNGEAVEFKGDPQTPLLWVLRDHFHLYGTKFGCGIGECCACTVHLNGAAQRSCITPVAAVDGAAIFNACGKRIRRLPIRDQLKA
ncbi:MAG: 2Fe-2S iron-sulfur cluster binding domain-containing protein [Pseudomonadales bacterium]|nr:2Fe-2S iron-sulfur cluster binding domain-containing protein [Pseudomonadales bacterium]